MNDGRERREQPTAITRSGRELVSMNCVQSDSERHTAVRGSVYLIVNDLIRGRVKIGYTTRDPIERAAELVTTGTTGTFVVIYEARVTNPYAVEQEVHRRLRNHNCGLEWFEVCPNRAKEEICTVAGQVFYEDVTPRWHGSQPEPSSETKELLREAKQAADERRRRAEEDARQARLAAEAARVKQAQEAAEAQRLADEEEYRRRAEEQAREAAIEEERRRLHDQRAFALADAQAVRDRRLAYFWHLGRWIAFASVLGWGAYLLWGPYMPHRVESLEKRCDTLAAEVGSLRATLGRRTNDLRLADRSRQSLEGSRETLGKHLVDHLSEKKMIDLTLAYSQRQYVEARSRYGRDGRPIPGRDGLSVSTIEAELAVRSKSFQAAEKSHDEWVAKEKMLRKEIEALPGRLENAEAVAREAVREVAALQKELHGKEKSLRVSKATLSRMRTHNARFAWLKIAGARNSLRPELTRHE
jgi:hypothetical protein